MQLQQQMRKSCPVLFLQIGKSLMDGARPPIPGPLDVKGGWFDMMDDYMALIEGCWAQNPQDRPSFAQIIVELRWALLVSHPSDRLCLSVGSSHFSLCMQAAWGRRCRV